jgi:hypothetical protein
MSKFLSISNDTFRYSPDKVLYAYIASTVARVLNNDPRDNRTNGGYTPPKPPLSHDLLTPWLPYQRKVVNSGCLVSL